MNTEFRAWHVDLKNIRAHDTRMQRPLFCMGDAQIHKFATKLTHISILWTKKVIKALAN